MPRELEVSRARSVPKQHRSSASPLRVAVPKGRVLRALADRFERAGVERDLLLGADRTLIRDSADGRYRFSLLKPDDVPTHVEYGAADVGIAGRDVLVERGYELYAPLDLGLGRCRMVVAARGPEALVPPRGRPIRVATKYPTIAERHFARRGWPAEIVFLQGSVELGPLTGLTDVIVDLVETGTTLRDNGLRELDEVMRVSSVVVVNRTALKLRRAEVAALLAALADDGEASRRRP